MKKRVLVGMSGGVDSSVTAALLKKRGYEVIGITFQLLPKESEKTSSCCNLNSVNDAKRVCSKLKIPHYTLNIRDIFKKNVIHTFINEYSLGLTPNPCVECNRHIKFNVLQEKAIELKADYVATGHYCKITKNNSKSKFFLKKAKDPKKDQSYFLYMLTNKQLSQTLFPLGNYLKSDIKNMALKMNLITAKKKESQDICFITHGSYKDFIEKQFENKGVGPGPIKDLSGNYLGTHSGISHYTIGQRKGLKIAHKKPLYVIKINSQENTIIVGEEDHLASSIITISKVSLVNTDKLPKTKFYQVKTRYQMTPFMGKIIKQTASTITVKSVSPQKFVTPGQSCVIYDLDTVIGGGIIVK
tara:strand:+ start:15 stop:1085 length:1071 start_codon:yes stop_codon:yes gene_type:complete